MKQGLFLVLIVLLSSCVDLKKSEQLESMDAISIDLSEVQELGLGCTDSIHVYVERVNHLDSLLKSTYKNDTLSFQNAENIDAFFRLKKVFPELKDKMLFIDSVLGLKSNSIEFLRKDIENSTGDRSKYPEFISFEQTEIQNIQTQLEETQMQLIESIETFNTLYPKVNDYLVSLQNEE